jgi:hypothetical protein
MFKELVMKNVSVVARILLGIVFLVFGLSGFFHFIPMPPPTGTAAQFFGAIFVSGYWVVIFLLQIIAGALLLANRFVPMALTILAPVIVNILAFHALMAPSGLPVALFVAVLWALAFIAVRPAFAGLFQSRLQQQSLIGQFEHIGTGEWL